ncbi:ABC transporter permease [Paenibacillus glycanilyticus]|uniref:Sugar ABC transporter permease n=1 Tax=Paenibacillus glycanilyticus TaxID=126569 RepID=A0ABQ6G9R9_9BACL|nr:ABC transporter permease subunit [Paenibacillus glycanilyticus]GLX66995.1 sugar ABC transporter permease [Paenibacillus glycanilyticus]
MHTELLAAKKTKKRSPSKKGILQAYIGQWDLQLMVIPGVLLVVLFSYVPMWGVLMSFQNYNLFTGFLDSQWVGMKHFDMFVHSSDFYRVMRNTLSISLLKLMFGFPAPIVLALLLNELKGFRFKRFVQTVSYLPHFMSWVIVSSFVISMLSVDNGSFNIFLMKLGIIHEPVNWLSTSQYFWGILVSSSVWKDVGFGAIVYLAAIAGIDPHLYEASAMDGAGRLRQIVSITIPSITPIIIIFLILNIGGILNAGFDDILNLTNNGANTLLRPVSDVIDTYVYRVGILGQRYSYATAVGLFKSAISVVLLVLANLLARRMGRSSLW